MTRQSVTQQLGRLEDANLVAAIRRGAKKYTISMPFLCTKSTSVGWRNTSANGWANRVTSRRERKEINMDKPQFVYVTYISTSPEKVWNALIDSKVTVKYWQYVNVSDWKPGSKWEHHRLNKEGPLDLVGKVVESSPPRRLVLTWAFPADETREEKHSRVTFEIEPFRDVVRLTVTHERLEPDSEMLHGITEGWPMVLSSLKSLLEVGKPLPRLW
jgi:uncharacterized protein YndB with AHSA1/START domain